MAKPGPAHAGTRAGQRGDRRAAHAGSSRRHVAAADRPELNWLLHNCVGHVRVPAAAEVGRCRSCPSLRCVAGDDVRRARRRLFPHTRSSDTWQARCDDVSLHFGTGPAFAAAAERPRASPCLIRLQIWARLSPAMLERQEGSRSHGATPEEATGGCVAGGGEKRAVRPVSSSLDGRWFDSTRHGHDARHGDAPSA